MVRPSSKTAAALVNVEAKGRIHVRSAGSMPAPDLDSAVVTAMAEMGVDLTKDYPKPLTDDVVRASDVVITMGCGDSCPIYPGKRYEDWDLPDPAEQSLETVRAIRDEIHGRVRLLVSSLLNKDVREGHALTGREKTAVCGLRRSFGRSLTARQEAGAAPLRAASACHALMGNWKRE